MADGRDRWPPLVWHQMRNRGLREATAAQQRDRDLVLYTMRHRPLTLSHAAPELQDDREVVTLAVERNGEALKYASDALRANREVAIAAVRRCGSALEYAAKELRGDKAVVLAAVRETGDALFFAELPLRDDLEVVSAAVAQSGRALEFASVRLRSHRPTVLTAVNSEGDALLYSIGALCDDRDLVLCAVRQCGEALEDASERLRGDREVVGAAVARAGAALEFASCALVRDRAMVLAAVRQDGRAIAFARSRLRWCRDIARAALEPRDDLKRSLANPLGPRFQRHNTLSRITTQTRFTVDALPVDLRADRNLVEGALRWSGHAIRLVGSELKANRSIRLAALRSLDGGAEWALSPELARNRAWVRRAVLRNGRALREAPLFVGDREIVLEAVRNSACAILHASEKLRRDAEVVRAAVRTVGYEYWGPVPLDLQGHRAFALGTVGIHAQALRNFEAFQGDPEVAMEAVRHHGSALKYVSEELQTRSRLVLTAVRQDGAALCFASDELQDDREVVLSAVRQWGIALQWASDELRRDRAIVLEAIRSHAFALGYAHAALDAANDPDLVRCAIEAYTRASIGRAYVEEDPRGPERFREMIAGGYLDEMQAWARSDAGCDDRMHLGELHARFIGCPVQSGNALLERFPRLGWCFRAQLQAVGEEYL